MGARAQLRQRLPLLPPPHRLQVGLAPAQCGGHQARAPHLPHIVLQLAGALARWLGCQLRQLALLPALRQLTASGSRCSLAGRHWLADSGWLAEHARCRVLPPPMPGVAFCRHLCQVSPLRRAALHLADTGAWACLTLLFALSVIGTAIPLTCNSSPWLRERGTRTAPTPAILASGREGRRQYDG
jgi:hypothetical protein